MYVCVIAGGGILHQAVFFLPILQSFSKTHSPPPCEQVQSAYLSIYHAILILPEYLNLRISMTCAMILLFPSGNSLSREKPKYRDLRTN